MPGRGRAGAVGWRDHDGCRARAVGTVRAVGGGADGDGRVDEEERRGQVAQAPAGGLAVRRARDGVDDVELVGHLEVGQLPAARLQEPPGVDALGAVGSRHQIGDGHLAEHGVGLAGHRRLGHAGHPGEHLLHLGGMDVLAAADDQLLGAPRDAESSGRVQAAEVAGAVPAVHEDGVGGLRVVVVADHGGRAVHPDLALLTRGHLFSGPGSVRRSVRPGRGVPQEPGTRALAGSWVVMAPPVSLLP